MSNAIMHLSAWAETQITMEKMQMQCPVERDEQQQNSGVDEQYWDGLEERASELADALIAMPNRVADASDYPMFFHHLTLAMIAESNDSRLHWLATIRDNVHARIKSTAREELRKSDLAGEEP